MIGLLGTDCKHVYASVKKPKWIIWIIWELLYRYAMLRWYDEVLEWKDSNLTAFEQTTIHKYFFMYKEVEYLK